MFDLKPEFITAIVGALGILIWGVRMTMQIGQMQLKIDTLWDFQLRRGMLEVVNHNLATLNSPLLIGGEAMKLAEDIADKLRALRRELGVNVPDRELAFEIEHRFGEILMQQICIPKKIDKGACLIIALAVAKETEQLECDLTHSKRALFSRWL